MVSNKDVNELQLAVQFGAKSYPDRRHSEKHYWFRYGDYDIWRHLHASKKEKREVWVVATRGRVGGEKAWLGPVRFYSLKEAFNAIFQNDWRKAEHQQSHVAHPTQNRKLLVNIRVTEDEYYQLKKRAGSRSVSDYVRETCLSE